MSYVQHPERPERPTDPEGGTQPRGSASTLACALGMASIGFGLLQFLAPRARGRGPEERRRRSGALRLAGLLEAALGLGLLASQDRHNWMWGRALNHAFQAGLLVPRLGRDNPYRMFAGAALGGLLASVAVDTLCARRLTTEERAVPRNHRRD